ncbi:U11/U12 small nuclear ribonucleoprotein 48 kDa protein-like [Zerene cesonia]|uniref:U11/U12 small nuclear ribonucleoprotein 48 kDa protein-like n=1 Tax=Zerene cesonia TaxID=33412 RepID=UPI0018E5953D|nr:U11/U12 small nuclear ribonucleoprotein 48 kDa protein-like [Zerene cesonia]
MSSTRQSELSDLKSYIKDVDNEITLILQSLQWNRSTLISGKPSVACAFDMTHKVPPENKATHEEKCWLKKQGYNAQDKMLPDPLDPNANTVVKLGPDDIKLIIETASNNNPNFKKGNGWSAPAPLTLERAQTTYTMDERRAIYDAVVASVPACHDLSDLALFDVSAVKSEDIKRSRTEILAELRDMKRRRTKYRVAAKTKNYSDVLRDVIRTQMEMFTDTQTGGYNSDVHSNVRSESTRRNDDCSNIQIKRERSTSMERDDNDGRNGNRRKDYPEYRNDSRDSRSSNKHHKRKRSKSRDIYEYSRPSSSNDCDRKKRDRKQKDDHRKDRTSRRECDEKTDRDKRGERRENRSYDESHRRDHTKQGYSYKYEDRRNDKYNRKNDERVRKRDDRRENDSDRRDKERTNDYVRDKRRDTSKYSKHDANSRAYHEDNRYWNFDATKIKQEVDDNHDKYDSQSGNGLEDSNPQEIKIKQEIDDYEYQ